MTAYKLPVLALLLTLTACSTTAPNPEQLKFLSRISDSGLKHFELRYQAMPSNDNRRQRPSGNPARRYEKDQERMTQLAEEQIVKNLYCREGFWVLNFLSNGFSHRLRGECHELASAADRERYPDTIQNW